MYTHTFRAMNTQFHIWLDGQESGARGALHEAEKFVREVEATLSRFRDDSALSRVNREPGRWHRVPPLMAEVLREALHWAERTDGVFDPTVLRALHAAGYDRTFEEVQARSQEAPDNSSLRRTMSSLAHLGKAWRDIRVVEDAVYLPPEVGIDLGGIAKEWTADRVAEMLAEWGPCLVDAGGDIRAIGAPALWGTWPVAVAHPLRPEEDVARFGLSNGAVATSSRARRRWMVGGREAHHIIDPRTGRPAHTQVVSATVIAPTAVMAGVLSKVLIIRGQDALEFVEQFAGCRAILVHQDDRSPVRYSPTLEVIYA